MKQLFLPLALLTSGFVYSADMKQQEETPRERRQALLRELRKATIRQLNLDNNMIEDIKKVYELHEKNIPQNFEDCSAVEEFTTLFIDQNEKNTFAINHIHSGDKFHYRFKYKCGKQLEFTWNIDPKSKLSAILATI